ncbi:MAG: transposase [Candidatus Viridilinea halotolerans]|uniref:Transposase n=1 Tax=Candidatus Viridilinea halotolerans TaxID=2491704 RepID=A0A426U8E9_9CHLR|nr:MAG: transposase [Candidatus Viridilinea halotolerans]
MTEKNGCKPNQPASAEVSPRATRRTFTREYKLRIVREAAEAAKVGGVGALLRREGLYSSSLVQWRREFPLDGEVSLEPRKRGPKPRQTAEQKAMAKLQRDNERLQKKLDLAEALLDLQKKARAIWGWDPDESKGRKP